MVAVSNFVQTAGGLINLQPAGRLADLVAGSAKQVKGAVKEAVGKVVGDAKLEAEAKLTRPKGKCKMPSAA